LPSLLTSVPAAEQQEASPGEAKAIAEIEKLGGKVATYDGYE
jgi:hypothetical protein